MLPVAGHRSSLLERVRAVELCHTSGKQETTVSWASPFLAGSFLPLFPLLTELGVFTDLVLACLEGFGKTFHVVVGVGGCDEAGKVVWFSHMR